MSNEWELTLEEAREIRKHQGFLDPYPSADRENAMILAGAEAQAKKLVEWLDKGSMDAHTIILQVNAEDWQALRKEVGD